MKYFKIILINILVFFSLVFLGEFSIRIIQPNFRTYKRTNPKEYPDGTFDNTNPKISWFKKDNDLGWVCKPDSFLKFSNINYNKYPTRYLINKEGFRNKIDFTALPISNNKKNLLLIGDSFIMSVYLDESKTITQNLQNRLKDNYQVLNLGIPGYGIDQSILAYEKYSKILHPDMVILFYIDEDIARILESFRKAEGMNKPSYNIVNDSLMLRIENSKSFIINIFENSYLLNRFYSRYLKYYSIKLAEKLFQKLIILTKIQKQRLIIIRCPRLEELLERNRFQLYSFNKFFNEENTEYYELYDRMINLSENQLRTIYLKNEGHPSEIGAKYFSDIIYEIISQKK